MQYGAIFKKYKTFRLIPHLNFLQWLIKITIKNDTYNYEKTGYNETDGTGFFLIIISNIPSYIMNSDFDLSIYVIGEVEAIYECHYDRQSGLCS